MIHWLSVARQQQPSCMFQLDSVLSFSHGIAVKLVSVDSSSPFPISELVIRPSPICKAMSLGGAGQEFPQNRWRCCCDQRLTPADCSTPIGVYEWQSGGGDCFTS